MRFQIKHLLWVLCLVFTAFAFTPIIQSANAQLPQCTCENSLESTCADGFRVTFEGRVNNTFSYSVCNETGDPQSNCIPPMALSHADIIITNPGCIGDPGADITTTIIGTDGQSMRACDAPTDQDPSCGFRDLNELLIKCDNTNGIFEPGPGECVTIEIQIENAPGITVGPSIALNKAGPECGLGCLLGPSCEGCGRPPDNPCLVNVEKVLDGSPGPAMFGFFVSYQSNPPDNFMQVLEPPNTPSFNFLIPENNNATILENTLPPGWMLTSAVCDNQNFCITNENGSITCRCPDVGGEVANCTFTNIPPDNPQEQCDIEIVKQTDPDNSLQLFDYISNQGAPNFSLQDNQSQQINNIDLGILTVVEETLPTDWVLDDIICSGGNQSQFEIDVSEDQLVRITCDDSAPGVTRTCTFFNRFDPPPPGEGCCVEAQGFCSITTASSCSVPPNLEFLGVGSTCDDPRCETPPPGEGCCVEAEGLCAITTAESCPVPPNLDFLGIGTNCTDEARCQLPPPPAVPTLGEWGLIAVAGLLGIYSLVILNRRRKYNLG